MIAFRLWMKRLAEPLSEYEIVRNQYERVKKNIKKKIWERLGEWF